MEIIRTLYIPSDNMTEADAIKSQFIGKKHVKLEARNDNMGKCYIGLSYEYSGEGRISTQYDLLEAGDIKFYSAPKGKKIYYVWYYGTKANDKIKLVASDGAIKDFQTLRNRIAGRKQRYDLNTDLVNNQDKIYDVVVPTNRIWLIHYGYSYNKDSVPRTTWAQIISKDGRILGNLFYVANLPSNQKVTFPSTNVSDKDTFTDGAYPIVLFGGDWVRFGWNAGGTSSGGTTQFGLCFTELIDIDGWV